MKIRHCIKIEAQTWASDSHDLFDYESGDILRREFRVDTTKDSYCIVREGSHVQVIPEDEMDIYKFANTNAVVLLRLQRKDDYYYMLPSSLHSNSDSTVGASKRTFPSSERLWLVVRSMRQGARLCAGDIVKLGRFQLKVKQIITSAEQDDQGIVDPLYPHEDDECETVAPDDSTFDVADEELSPDDSGNMDITSDLSSMRTSRNRDSERRFVRNRSSSLRFPETMLPAVSYVAAAPVVPQTTNQEAVASSTPSVAEIPRPEIQCSNSRNTEESVPNPSNLVAAEMPYDSNSYSADSLLLNDMDQKSVASICRICYGTGEDSANPLISPCKCKGSMQFVHLNCLRTWMEERLNIHSAREGDAVSFFWKVLDCELCNAVYPTHVRVENQKVELLKIPRPNRPFLVIEPRFQRDRGLHVICLANTRVVRLGRGHGSDVRFADISVSRLHASLKYQRGEILLEDHASKFGTLLEVRDACRLENGSTRTLQVGRTHITITIKRKWSVFPFCPQGGLRAEHRMLENEEVTTIRSQ